MSLTWTSISGVAGLCAELPDHRVAFVAPAKSGNGYSARLAQRLGAMPHALALYATEAAAIAWVERIAAGCRRAA